jgi:integrase
MGTKTQAIVAPGIHRLMNGSFRVRVATGDRQRGGQQRETTFPGGASIRDMKAWQTTTKAELLRSGLIAASGTLESDLPRYMDRVRNRLAFPEKREDDVQSWLVRFGTRRRHTITRKEVSQQVKDWLATNVAASTIRKRITALATLYDELDGEGINNPARGVKRPKEPDPMPNAVPPQVIDAALGALAARVERHNKGWKTLARARVLAYTGMRPSQMMRLDINSHVAPYLDQEIPMVYVPAGKGGKPHWKPLTADGVEAFRLFIKSNAQGHFSTSSFYKSWMLACDEASAERFNPYRLRHSYATLLRRGGADIADVQELLGHKSPETTQRYSMVIPEKLVGAVHQMQAVWDHTRGQGAGAKPQVAEKKAASK